jgi:hypothetical protein
MLSGDTLLWQKLVTSMILYKYSVHFAIIYTDKLPYIYEGDEKNM